MTINNDHLLDLIREASATYILPRYKALKNHEISTKTNPNDLVTQADIEAEAFFEKTLPSLLSGSVVIGEEGVSRGDHTLDELDHPDHAVWVVDPVDGTYNFVHGGSEFAVMIALVKGGETIGGWIYDVLNDSLTHTIRGEGAYKDGVPLRIPQAGEKPLQDMIIHLSPKFFPGSIRQSIKDKGKAIGKNVRTVGSAAHEYMKIAQGISDSAVYCRLKPWDHLAGTLLVQEAGGYVAKWDGRPYTPQDRYAGLIAAHNRQSWQNVYDAFFGDLDLTPFFELAEPHP
jgi:fructose-1,6-bisphosphatase/inositol monophosphatase family enzyme